MPTCRHLIYVAMLEEARTITQSLNCQTADKSLWPYSEAFVLEAWDAILITGGQDSFAGKRLSRIGKAAAAQMTALAIARFSPNWIWNVGTCGGITDFGAKIGDVYTGHVQQHDMRVPLAIFEDYAKRVYKTYVSKAFPTTVKSGLISTGDSFDKGEAEWQHIHQTRANVVDMEAFAVAETVASLRPAQSDGSLPLILIKGVTDTVTLDAMHAGSIHDAAKDFSQNLKRAMLAVSETLSHTLANWRDTP